MITYKLNGYGLAQKFVDGFATGKWANIESNQAYLAWVAEGNTPEEASQ